MITQQQARGCTRKLDDVGSGSPAGQGRLTKKQRLVAGEQPAARGSVGGNCSDTNAMGKTVTELNSQAMSYYTQGDFDMAAALFRKAICLRSQQQASITSENNTYNTSTNSGSLPPPSSYIYQRMDFDEGMTVFSEPMPVQADDHPQAIEATLLFNAGQARRKLHDVEGATKFYDQALKIFLPPRSGTSPKDLACIRTIQPVIIPLLHAVGQLAYRNGKLEDGLSVYETALRLCQDNDGVSKARTLNCLGVLCYHLSSEHSERAERCFEEALVIQAKAFGGGSFESATTMNNLGRVHVQREEFSVALGLYEKAMKIRIGLGEENIDYAATAFNAGQSLHQLGEFDKALQLYQEFLRVALKKFSRNHRDVAVVLSGIAQIYQEKKDYDKALSLYEESLVVGRAALGNSHTEVAMLLNRLGNYHFDRGDFAQALTAYEEGLQIEQRVLNKDHPNVIVTLSNIAEIYRQRNDLESAVRIYLDALRLQKKCYGASSVEAAATLNVLGLIYDLQGNATMALSCLQEALVIRRSVLGDNHNDVSATLTYLATIFYRRGSTCMALQLFSESLRIRIQLHGKIHRDVSFALYNVGLCHFNIGCFDEAIISYKETLQIEKAVLGEHRDVAMTYFKLGEVYAANRDFKNALECFEAALKIEKQVAPDAEPKTIARILNEIGNVHLAAGSTELRSSRSGVAEAMDAFVDAARVLKEAGLYQHDSLTLPDQLYAFAAACPSSASAA